MATGDGDQPLLDRKAWQNWAASAVMLCGRPDAWAPAALIWLVATTCQAVLIRHGMFVMVGLCLAVPLVSAASGISASVAAGYTQSFASQIRQLFRLPVQGLLVAGLMYTGATMLGFLVIASLVAISSPAVSEPAAVGDIMVPSGWQILKGSFMLLASGVLLPICLPPMTFVMFLVASREVPIFLACRRSRLMVVEAARTPMNAIVLLGFPPLIATAMMLMPLNGVSNLGPLLFLPFVYFALAFHWSAAVDLSVALAKRRHHGQ